MKGLNLIDRLTSFKDNCGFGLVASINNIASHNYLENAITALERMMHRGAVAADGKTGDGSGLLLSMPKKFMAKKAQEAGIDLPEQYAVAMVFSKDPEHLNVLEAMCEKNDLKVIWKRTVPVDKEAL